MHCAGVGGTERASVLESVVGLAGGLARMPARDGARRELWCEEATSPDINTLSLHDALPIYIFS